MHANFSTTYLREVGGKEYFEKLMEAFKTTARSHRRLRPDNHMRLTGSTSGVDRHFTYGLATAAPRSACALLRHSGYKGYLETAVRLPGRPLPDRFPDPEDDRFGSDRCQVGCGLRNQGYPGGAARVVTLIRQSAALGGLFAF